MKKNDLNPRKKCRRRSLAARALAVALSLSILPSLSPLPTAPKLRAMEGDAEDSSADAATGARTLRLNGEVPPFETVASLRERLFPEAPYVPFHLLDVDEERILFSSGDPQDEGILRLYDSDADALLLEQSFPDEFISAAQFFHDGIILLRCPRSLMTGSGEAAGTFVLSYLNPEGELQDILKGQVSSLLELPKIQNLGEELIFVYDESSGPGMDDGSGASDGPDAESPETPESPDTSDTTIHLTSRVGLIDRDLTIYPLLEETTSFKLGEDHFHYSGKNLFPAEGRCPLLFHDLSDSYLYDYDQATRSFRKTVLPDTNVSDVFALPGGETLILRYQNDPDAPAVYDLLRDGSYERAVDLPGDWDLIQTVPLGSATFYYFNDAWGQKPLLLADAPDALVTDELVASYVASAMEENSERDAMRNYYHLYIKDESLYVLVDDQGTGDLRLERCPLDQLPQSSALDVTDAEAPAASDPGAEISLSEGTIELPPLASSSGAEEPVAESGDAPEGAASENSDADVETPAPEADPEPAPDAPDEPVESPQAEAPEDPDDPARQEYLAAVQDIVAYDFGFTPAPENVHFIELWVSQQEKQDYCAMAASEAILKWHYISKSQDELAGELGYIPHFGAYDADVQRGLNSSLRQAGYSGTSLYDLARLDGSEGARNLFFERVRDAAADRRPLMFCCLISDLYATDASYTHNVLGTGYIENPETGAFDYLIVQDPSRDFWSKYGGLKVFPSWQITQAIEAALEPEYFW